MPGSWSQKHQILPTCIDASLWQSMLILTLQSSTPQFNPRCFCQCFFCSDAAHPRAAPPTLTLVGAEATCAPLRLQIRNHRWSIDKSLLDNILFALSLATLPSPPRPSLSAVEEEGLVALECGICYAYRMQVLSSHFHPSLAQNFILSSAFCSQPYQIRHVPIPSVQKRESFLQIFQSAKF
jgi:hypothetical protein